MRIVESIPGKGTRFRFDVPTGPLDGVDLIEPHSERAARESNLPLPRPSEITESLAGVRILLAEDGPDNQRLISFVLKKAGGLVRIVGNGQEAVDAAFEAEESGQPFHVILMDMQMPVLDGYEATKLLRVKGYERPIIALTAHAMSGDREKCLSAGCDDYANKPIAREKLISQIAKHAAIEEPDLA